MQQRSARLALRRRQSTDQVRVVRQRLQDRSERRKDRDRPALPDDPTELIAASLCNAGVMVPPFTRPKQGFELQFGDREYLSPSWPNMGCCARRACASVRMCDANDLRSSFAAEPDATLE